MVPEVYFKKQGRNEIKSGKRKTNMVANLYVINLKSKWEQQKRIDTDTCERKNENRCQQLENQNDKRQVAPILGTLNQNRKTYYHEWVARSWQLGWCLASVLLCIVWHPLRRFEIPLGIPWKV